MARAPQFAIAIVTFVVALESSPLALGSRMPPRYRPDCEEETDAMKVSPKDYMALAVCVAILVFLFVLAGASV